MRRIWNGKGKEDEKSTEKTSARELKTEFGKYLVIFLLLVATIGLVSGFLVADWQYDQCV